MQRKLIHFSYHILLLIGIPTVFILFYKFAYYNPLSVIYQHLTLTTLFVAFIFATHFILNYLVKNRKIALFISATIYASFLLTLLIYYALVFISLRSWNRVITEEFIVAYTYQAHFFLDAIGLSIYPLLVIFISSYVILITVAYFFHCKFNYLSEKKHATSPALVALAFSICLYAYYNINDYLISNHQGSKEPVVLTLHSGKPKSVQTHEARLGYLSNEELNLAEDNARKNYHTKPSSRKRNLVVMVVDALRPDHMGVYQYHRDTTPHLQKIVDEKQAVLFKNLRSVCGETTCAHAGFMASRFIHQLPDNLFTLQEVLKLNGYRTQLIISGDHINFHNIREVYGNVDDYYDGSMAKGYYFNDDVITINKTANLPTWDGKPTLLHYHILSAHQVGKKEPEFARYKPSESYLGKRSGKAEDKYTNFYDNGILQADAVVKKLLDTLKNKKYLEDAIVLITADHGEALGEKLFFMHTNSVIEPVLNIPLLMIQYGEQSNFKQYENKFFSLADLAPTILYELDLTIPQSWIGIPLQTNDTRQYTFFEMTPFKGLYDNSDNNTLWKYWINTNTGEEFVYNLSLDSAESKNLVWQVSSKQKEQWRKATDFNVSN